MKQTHDNQFAYIMTMVMSLSYEMEEFEQNYRFTKEIKQTGKIFLSKLQKARDLYFGVEKLNGKHNTEASEEEQMNMFDNMKLVEEYFKLITTLTNSQAERIRAIIYEKV